MTTVTSTGNSYLDTLMASSSASTSGSSSSSSSTTKSNSTIDQSGFLKLLTTQLSTQDPTAPTDNSQMVEQMATFSEVSGITQMGQTLTAMASDISASRFGSAASLVGRAALLQSNTAAQASTGAYAGQITLPSDAKDVTITLTNSSGQTVYSKDLGAQAAGSVNWSWDGKDTAGTLTSDGTLTVNVGATGTSGAALTTTSNTWNEITSVKSPSTGTTSLVTGLGSTAASSVIQLS